jgi:hypothetical protein
MCKDSLGIKNLLQRDIFVAMSKSTILMHHYHHKPYYTLFILDIVYSMDFDNHMMLPLYYYTD